MPYWRDTSVAGGGGLLVAASDACQYDKQRAFRICDGVDDQVEIQAALDYLEAQTDGGKLSLSAGNFSIGPTAGIVLPSNVILRGAGVNTTFLKLAATCSSVDLLAQTSSGGWVFIQDMTIDGNEAATATGNGIVMAASSVDHRIDNVFVRSFSGDGIVLADCWGTYLSGVVVEFCKGNGIVINGGTRLMAVNLKILDNENWGLVLNAVAGCQFSNIDINGWPGYGAINLVDSNQNHFTNIRLAKANQANTADLLRLEESVGTTNYNMFSGCNFYGDDNDQSVVGVNIQAGCRSNQFFGNRFDTTKIATVFQEGDNSQTLHHGKVGWDQAVETELVDCFAGGGLPAAIVSHY